MSLIFLLWIPGIYVWELSKSGGIKMGRRDMSNTGCWVLQMLGILEKIFQSKWSMNQVYQSNQGDFQNIWSALNFSNSVLSLYSFLATGCLNKISIDFIKLSWLRYHTANIKLKQSIGYFWDSGTSPVPNVDILKRWRYDSCLILSVSSRLKPISTHFVKN